MKAFVQSSATIPIMKRKYYITGIAGTGKSTIASELKKLGFEVYDIDAVVGLCHWRHKLTREEAKYHTGVGKDWLEAHQWICDEEKLTNLINKNHNSDTVVVGIASNQDSYLGLFDKIFLLYCSEETFIKRINSRNDGNNFGKDESEQEHILGWYEDFQAKIENLGAILINTDAPLERVVNRIRDEILEI